jgi:hypothetical protein
MPNGDTRLFHIGPQKGATTWIYECLKNHPDIRTSARDTIHYYDMNYHQNRDWYDTQFTKGSGTCYFDPTFTYLRSPVAATRIKDDFPNAKIIVNLRNPIDRAFAHYWHERKKGAITVPFNDVFTNYDWYQTWIETGQYSDRLKPYVDAFGIDNILPIIMTDIRDKPSEILEQIYKFAGIQSVPIPDAAHKIVNADGAKQNFIRRAAYKTARKLTNDASIHSPFWRKVGGIENQSDAITPQIHQTLLDMFMDDIVNLEKMFGLNFDTWKS